MALKETVLRAGLVRPSRLALSACGLIFVLVLCAGLLAFLNNALDPYYSSWSVLAVANAAVGGVVAAKKPANPVGWLFLGTALFMTLHEFARQWTIYGLTTEPGALPFPWAAGWAMISFGPLGAILTFVILPLYFPDGRLVSPRWRPITRLVVLVMAANLFLNSLLPGSVKADFDTANPLGVEALRPYADALYDLGLVVFLGCILVAVLSLAVRFRRSRGDERQQVKWILFAVAAVLVWFCVNWPLEPALPNLFPVLDALVISGIPVAAGIAVLKYRLYDIDLVINRTLVYAALTALVVAVYVAVVVYLGGLLQAQDNLAVSLLAAGFVAVLFTPLRDRLQRGVNRLMYGERDEPFKVLAGLGERMESAPEPDAVLPGVVQTVAQALRLPHVAIRLKQNGEEGLIEAARYGNAPATEPLVLPLAYRKEEVGELVLSPRAGSEGFAKSEVGLLEALARQIGIAAHAVRLNEDLRRSREKLVAAREEERRRLRRDLHDGVGPQLAALMLELETASDLVSDNPEASALMAKLSIRARETVSDVRRSVRGLRPPALDELGLVGALREVEAQYGRRGLRVSVEAPYELPPLPAAVEVACYMIAREAVTNAVRHAQASNCRVRIGLDEAKEALSVEVEDDGTGIREGSRAGVGMNSMRERAEELGGRCAVGSPPRGGTLVSALLPCRTADVADRGGD